jgi:hypothetical protein
MMAGIDLASVRFVLLADHEWYQIRDGTSFEVGTYSFVRSGMSLPVYDGTEPSFRFTGDAGVHTGPLSSILALRLG